MSAVRKHAETIAVAAVTAFVVAAGPAIATTIPNLALNSLKLGGKPASSYELVRSANHTFLSKTGAANTYLTQSAAASTYADRASEAYHDIGAPGEPAFLNGYGNIGSGLTTAGFYLDDLNVVHLKGAVTEPSAATAFILPSGYRPSAILVLPVAVAGNFGNAIVLPDGSVEFGCNGGGSCGYGIDGLSFRVGAGSTRTHSAGSAERRFLFKR